MASAHQHYKGSYDLRRKSQLAFQSILFTLFIFPFSGTSDTDSSRNVTRTCNELFPQSLGTYWNVSIQSSTLTLNEKGTEGTVAIDQVTSALVKPNLQQRNTAVSLATITTTVYVKSTAKYLTTAPITTTTLGAYFLVDNNSTKASIKTKYAKQLLWHSASWWYTVLWYTWAKKKTSDALFAGPDLPQSTKPKCRRRISVTIL